jgi:cysteine desulfurase / selenocysteine lyase
VLYGKRALLNAMPPYQGGGDMISSVTFAKTTYNDLCRSSSRRARPTSPAPSRSARRSITSANLGMDRDRRARAASCWPTPLKQSAQFPAFGSSEPPSIAPECSRLCSINVHPHDLGTILDREGIAIRTGHHCAQPVMERFGIAGTARASFAVYNTKEEVDALVAGIRAAREVFA